MGTDSRYYSYKRNNLKLGEDFTAMQNPNYIEKLMNERADLWEAIKATELKWLSEHPATMRSEAAYVEAKNALKLFDRKINNLLGI